MKVAVLLKEVKFKIKEGVNGSYRRKTLVCDFEMKTKLSHYNCIKCGKEISCKSDFLLHHSQKNHYYANLKSDLNTESHCLICN